MRWLVLLFCFAGCDAGFSARDLGPDLALEPDLSFSCPDPRDGQPCSVPGAVCDNPAVVGCTYTCRQGVWSPDFCEPPMTLIGCADFITCQNACTTQACLTECSKMATAQANTLNTALGNCIDAQCGSPPDGGIGVFGGPCAMDDVTCGNCVAETQTGTSPTGHTNAMCTDNSTPPVASTAPVCGLCVDQLIACINDWSL